MTKKNGVEWKDACIWALITVFGGLFPIWGSLLFFALFSQPQNISIFTESGEFVIFSVGLLTSSLYTIIRGSNTNFFRDIIDTIKRTKRHKSTQFPGYRGFLLWIFISIVVAVIIFVSNIASNIPNANLKFNSQIFSPLSYGILLISFILSFIVVLLDNYQQYEPSVSDVTESTENLIKEFDKTR